MLRRGIRGFQYLIFLVLLTIPIIAPAAQSGWIRIEKPDRFTVTTGLSFYVNYLVTEDTTYCSTNAQQIYAKMAIEVDGGSWPLNYFMGTGDYSLCCGHQLSEGQVQATGVSVLNVPGLGPGPHTITAYLRDVYWDSSIHWCGFSNESFAQDSVSFYICDGANDPCCQPNADLCCWSGNECCGNPDPCCGNPDPCCGHEGDPCCGDPCACMCCDGNGNGFGGGGGGGWPF